MADTVTMSHADDVHAGGGRAGDAHPDAGHGSGHDRDEPGEPLGPVDVRAWAYALVGGAIGVVTAAALFAASS
jgi:hypothetical protein